MRYLSLLITLIALAGCAKPQVSRQDFPPEQIIHLNQFRKLKDPDAITSHVAYLDDGDIIPVKIKIESDLVGLYQDQVDLIVKQKTYFRLTFPPDMTREKLAKIMTLVMDQESLAQLTPDEKKMLFKGIMLYLSPDAIHWAPLSDMRALKELFGIKGGQVSLGASMSEAEGFGANFSLKINKRANQ